MKNVSNLFLVSLLSGATTLGGYKLFVEQDANRDSIVTQSSNLGRSVGLSSEAVDFVEAADKAVHTVVHVKNVSVRTVYNPIMEFFMDLEADNNKSKWELEVVSLFRKTVIS